MKKISFVLIGLIIASAFWLLFIWSQNQSQNLSIQISSDQLSSRAEKDEILKRYLDKDLPLTNAEFSIFFHDNSRGMVPGPSEWDISIIGNVKMVDLSKWTKDLQKSTSQLNQVTLPSHLERFRPTFKNEECFGERETSKHLCYSVENEILYVRYLAH